jgi:hypothetical protein
LWESLGGPNCGVQSPPGRLLRAKDGEKVSRNEYLEMLGVFKSATIAAGVADTHDRIVALRPIGN